MTGNSRTPDAPNDPHLRAHRVIACLNRKQVDFLDRIGKDAQFSSGMKLSRNQILAAMVNALQRLNLTGEGIQTADQFEQRILDAIRRAQPTKRGPGDNGDSPTRGAHH